MTIIKEGKIGAKILFVDDEPDLELLISQIFQEQIETKNFEFVFAHDGQEALDKLIAKPYFFDVVLTDINMPKMDGLTLLEKLQECLKEKFPLIKVVIISAYGDMHNIRKAMNNGAFDFITKPFDFDDLELTLDKALRVVQEIKEAWKRERETGRNLRNFLNTNNSPLGVNGLHQHICGCSFTTTHLTGHNNVLAFSHKFFTNGPTFIIDCTIFNKFFKAHFFRGKFSYNKRRPINTYGWSGDGHTGPIFEPKITKSINDVRPTFSSFFQK